MANGVYWNISPVGTIRIFNEAGSCPDDETWWTKEGAIRPQRPSLAILEVIRDDVQAGHGGMIAFILVASDVALMLALEGVIKEEHLVRATEPEGAIVCENVTFGSVERKVIIRDGIPAGTVATLDDQGNVIQ